MVISRPFSLNLARIWAHFYCENCFYKKDVLYSNLLARLIPPDRGCFTCRNFYWAQSGLGAQLYYKSLVLLRLTKNNRYLWVCLWSSISLSAALFPKISNDTKRQAALWKSHGFKGNWCLGHVVCCGVLADTMHMHPVNCSLIAPLHEHFALKIKALREFSISAIQTVAWEQPELFWGPLEQLLS